jgi:hypothetical protein
MLGYGDVGRTAGIYPVRGIAVWSDPSLTS